MSLSHGILGFLSYGSMSGYDLAKKFGSSVKFFWYAQTSHIYHELNKLEKKEFVTCELVIQTDKPSKKLYSITESGREEFFRWLGKEEDKFSKGNKDAFLMRIFFSDLTPPEQSISMLKKFKGDCEKHLNELNNIPNTINKRQKFADPYKRLCWELTADYGYSYFKMCMDWADRCIKKLEEIT